MKTNISANSDICKEAIIKFGLEPQARQLMEECGELITATNHFIRHKGKRSEDIDGFIEELADVIIMITQFCVYFNWTDAVNEVVEDKLLKLSARLESIKKTNMMDDLP